MDLGDMTQKGPEIITSELRNLIMFPLHAILKMIKSLSIITLRDMRKAVNLTGQIHLEDLGIKEKILKVLLHERGVRFGGLD